MPIKVPDTLPARDILMREGVSVLRQADAARQDIRPLKIGLLNLMPDKIRTETQIARLLGAGPLQIELTLIRIGAHKSKTTSEQHLLSHYQTWQDIRHEKFDGFIITGAPIEMLDYEAVSYWPRMREILNWTRTHVHSCFYICWGAMAALWHFHRIQKYTLPTKAFGVYRHKNLEPTSPYLTGFSDDFQFPVSRNAEIQREDILSVPDLRLLVESDFTGPCLVSEPDRRALYMFNHIEYDSLSLKEEYERDYKKNRKTRPPHGYFPGDDIQAKPLNRWRANAHLLFGNWINQVYQSVPFKIEDIGV